MCVVPTSKWREIKRAKGWRKSYTASAEPDGPFWLVRVPELGRATQATSLDDADAAARDLIALITGEAPDSFDIELQVAG
jgi:hypothetical protein